MRLLLTLGLVGALTAAAGCHKAEPTMAHGKSVGQWVAALREPDARARLKAVRVLGNVGAIDPAVVPALADAVRDPDEAVRAEAVLALTKIGPAARDAVPALTAAQNDPSATVRRYAAQALARVRGGGS
jgi:HEAT repeat protein